jgi:hypothetical protein
MKIKLDRKHQWTVESKDDPDILDVTTPNGHHMQFVHGMNTLSKIYEIDRPTYDAHPEFDQSTRFQILEFLKSRPTRYPLFCVVPTTRDDRIYDFTTRKDSLILATLNISKWHIDFTNHVLKYDRECETVRCLQVLANVAEHIVGRPDIMDTFTDIVSKTSVSNTKNESYKT